MEWISYGDDNTRTFFAKAKQRKLASYIYQIRDTEENLLEGFDRVGQTMMSFYKALLGDQSTIRQPIAQEVVNQGPTLTMEQQVHMCNEFTDLEIKEAIFSIPNTKSSGPDDFSMWDWQGDPDYKVAQGYKWQQETQGKVPWTKLIWARSNVPRNAFISWVLIQHRLPTKSRIEKFQPQADTLCVLCSTEEEEEEHLFYTCNYAKAIWTELKKWWSHTPNVQNNRQLMGSLKHGKSPGLQKQITITATFHYIWSARNHRIFQKQQIIAHQTAYLIKDQVRSRILFLSKCFKKYSSYIDSILA
ncbi:hypothetical protein Cgig2_027990 [Carnegiea gigantea]|uniref:Reverse transcriptase zinc-binding domain-containing protein n=1 Tax=Carnegiea gigantea TaxID=171969 RepID=A0A9Q1JNT5_9CARY|nr:hypothetical protein Cgig2_027990 [Carnegiea gigantea]